MMADTNDWMISVRRRLGSPSLRDQSGFTLVEVMIVAVLLVVVVGAISTVIGQTAKSAARDDDRNVALNEVRAGVLRMTTELRQAYRVNGCGTATPATCTLPDYARTVDFNVRGNDRVARRVIYDCTAAFDGETRLPRGAQTTPGTADERYRTCVRKASTTLTAPPTVVTARVVQRVLNWCRGTAVACPAGGSATMTPAVPPIFSYRSADLSGTTGAVALDAPSGTAAPSGRDPRLATSIYIAIETPSAGERRVGIGGNILLQDGGYLRNIDLQ